MSQPIVFTGSSIIALWENFPPVMAGLSTLNTAISGSQTHDLLPRLEELVIRYDPRAVCYYCGSNDLNNAVPPEQICSNVQETFRLIRSALPRVSFIYLAVIKAPQKQERWRQVDEVNRVLQDWAGRSPGFAFIDINPVFFDDLGQARPDYYLEDRLHLTAPAYASLAAFLEPRLTVALARE